MLKRILWLSLLLILLSSLAVNSYQAQDIQEDPPQRVRFVGIISGRDLNTAAPSNIGDDGVTRLTEVLRGLGASVYTIPPNQEIPREIELLVIIRPQRAFSTAQTAYVWDFLQRGGHLLLALDPNGLNRVSSESARNSGINRLLQTEYGLSIADDLLVEDWFGLNTLNDVVSSWSEARAENLVPHPITTPLIQYDLPIRFWGGRSVFVDALSGIATTNPLIYTENPYGETSRINFQDTETEQLLLNIGADTRGRLLLGGIGENLATGSRVALIGDGEIFQNIYGQTRIPGRESLPVFVGDYVFTQRLLSWLMAIPESEWRDLPQGFTWIALDGDGSDWSSSIPVLMDSETNLPFYSLHQIRAFRNDQFVYLLLETLNPLPINSSVILFIEDSNGTRQVLNADWNGQVHFQDVVIPDAIVVFGQAVELRIPRRLFPTDANLIAEVCVFTSVGSQADCYEEPVQATSTNELDPVPLRFGAIQQAFTLNNTNLRLEPNTGSDFIVSLPFRTQLAVFGRNEAGDWLFVRNGRYEGWVSSSLLELNAETSSISKLEEVSLGTELNLEVEETQAAP